MIKWPKISSNSRFACFFLKGQLAKNVECQHNKNRFCHFENSSTKAMLRGNLVLLLLACLIRPELSFYVPGVAPKEFKVEDPIEVKASFVVNIDEYFRFSRQLNCRQ
jgi:hypothetical protein